MSSRLQTDITQVSISECWIHPYVNIYERYRIGHTHTFTNKPLNTPRTDTFLFIDEYFLYCGVSINFSTASPSPPCPWCWGCTCGGWRGHTPSWRACPPPRSQTGTRWLDSSWNWNVLSLFSIYNIPTWFEFQCFWYYITSLTCIYKISFIVKKWSLGTWGLW